MADGMTQPAHSDEGPSHEDAAPRWLAATVLALLAGVLILSGLVAYRFLGRSLDAAQGQDPRISSLAVAVRADPADVDARRQLAFSYQRAGQFGDAVREYKKVLSEKPDDLASLYNMGVIYLDTGKERDGEELLLQVMDLAPTHVLAAKALGDYYSGSGQYARVVQVVVPAVEARPELADLQYLAGLGYEKTGHEVQAVERYRKALHYVPDMVEATEALERLGDVR
jgi:tetratricopeptide (TPR) repeat protein